MGSSARTSMAIIVIASLLIIGSLNFIPSIRAADQDLVPEPWVHETHEFNVQGDTDPAHGQGFWANEKWSIEVRHGEVMTLIMARNITQDNNVTTDVDYTMNIHYTIGGTLYIAQFMIMQVAFVIGGMPIFVPLKTCGGLELTYSPIKYNGTVPTMDCNITFENIQIYSTAAKNSTFNLTLLHHIAGNWNDTDIKVEAQFDFSHTRFINASTQAEYPAGEPFAAEIHYMMMLANPNTFSTSGPIMPTGHTNTTMEYNMTLDNGIPLVVSELKMKKTFTAYNATSSKDMVGYSSIAFGGQSQVTHGFPNLTYKNTTSMKSDPEIIVRHDRVSESNNQNPFSGSPQWGLIIAVIAVGAIGAIGATVLIKKRKKNKREKDNG